MIFKGTVYRRSSSDRPRQPEVAGEREVFKCNPQQFDCLPSQHLTLPAFLMIVLTVLVALDPLLQVIDWTLAHVRNLLTGIDG